MLPLHTQSENDLHVCWPCSVRRKDGLFLHCRIVRRLVIMGTETAPEGRERRLRNLIDAVGSWLEKEAHRDRVSLSNTLSQNFAREIAMADTCVYNSDFDGALCHGITADLIHDALKDLEAQRRQ